MPETIAQAAVGRHGAAQDEWELGRLVDVIGGELAGRLVVEIGCDRGGTLWLWCELGAQVVAVTTHTRADRQFLSHGAMVVVGDSTDSDTRSVAEHAINGRDVAMVFVDGGHDYFTACQDIAWAIQLCPNGIIVVHDVNRRIGHPEIETYMAWLEFAEDRPHIVISWGGDRSPGTGIMWPLGSRNG